MLLSRLGFVNDTFFLIYLYSGIQLNTPAPGTFEWNCNTNNNTIIIVVCTCTTFAFFACYLVSSKNMK